MLCWLKANCFAAKLAIQKGVVLKAGLGPALAALPHRASCQGCLSVKWPPRRDLPPDLLVESQVSCLIGRQGVKMVVKTADRAV